MSDEWKIPQTVASSGFGAELNWWKTSWMKVEPLLRTCEQIVQKKVESLRVGEARVPKPEGIDSISQQMKIPKKDLCMLRYQKW
jgi:hypothetical protein